MHQNAHHAKGAMLNLSVSMHYAQDFEQVDINLDYRGHHQTQ